MKKIYALVLICIMSFVANAQSVLYVNADGVCGGNSPCYTTIQAAITAANPGDTISVAAGSYTESLLIGKSLVLKGAKFGVDARTRNTTSGESILDGSGLSSPPHDGIKIANNISNVVIDGFEIRNFSGAPGFYNGDGNAISSYCMGGATTGANYVSIRNNYIHDVDYNGVLVGSENDNGSNSMIKQHDWLIQFNKISSYKYAGIELTNVYNSAVLDNDITAVTSLFNDPGDAGVGIEIAARSRGQASAVTGVIVRGNQITGAFPSGSRAAINILSRAYDNVLSNASFSGVTIDSNTITGATQVRAAILAVAEARTNSVGASLSTVSITNNTLDGNYNGIQIQDTLRGGTSATHSAITINNNFIKNSTANGIHVTPSTTGSGITVSDNDITGNAVYGLLHQGADTVSATCNWWGSTTYASIQAMNSGGVHYVPYLSSGTDDQTGVPGFQPVSGSCTSYPIHINGTGYASLQEAIDNITPGDTLKIATGTYNGNLDATVPSVFVSPGASPGCVTITGDLFLTNDDSLLMEVNGTTACTDYDQFIVGSDVTLGNAKLKLTLGYTPGRYDVIKLIDNQGSNPVNGTFIQGSTITVDGYTFSIKYDGGDGNDVVLFLGPKITCRADTATSNDADVCTATVNGLAPTIEYGLGNQVTYQVTGATDRSGNDDASGSFNKGISQVKYVVTDSVGNKDSCTFNVTVADTTKPAFTRPNDTTLYKAAECSFDASIGVTGDVSDESDNCPSTIEATSSDTTLQGDCPGSIVIKRTWELLDSSDNKSTQVQTITILDSTRPSFNRPADTTIYTGAACAFDSTMANTGTATDISDNCSSGLQATYSDETVAGDYSGAYIIHRTWHLVDSCGNTAADQVQTITVSDTTRPVITSALINAHRHTDAGTVQYEIQGEEFDVNTATDNCSVADSIVYNYQLSGATSASGTGSLAKQLLEFGTTTVRWIATDDCGNTSNAYSFDVLIDTVTTQISIINSADEPLVDPSVQQYSDSVTFAVQITPWESAGGVDPSGYVRFTVANEVIDSVVVDAGGLAIMTRAMLEHVLDYANYNAGHPTNGQLKPGIKDVKVDFVSTSTVYEDASETFEDALTITEEDAIVRIDNTTSYFTVNPTTYKGTVWFRSNVDDINDLPIGGRGDIRNATLQFIDALTGTPLSTPRNVGLIDPSDSTKGISLLSLDYTLSTSEIAAGGRSWLVWANAGNYYTGEDRRDMNVVTLALPGTDFVTGGGYYPLRNSGGLYAGTAGTRMNFGFNMKWNKTGKNLQGKINVIYRREIGGVTHIFHIKSNAVDALTVSSTAFTDSDAVSRSYSTAVMMTQASLTDITDPLNPIGYGGNNKLRVLAWDNKATGSAGEWDKVAVELLDGKTSQVLFSSNLLGGTTTVQTIVGGNVNVRNSTIPSNGCGAPSGLQVVSVTTTGANLKWTTVNGAVSYNLQYRIQGASSWTPVSGILTNTYSLSSLTPGTHYEWQVQTVCTSTSSWSASSLFMTQADCSLAPAGTTTLNVTTSSATFSWNAVAGISSYEVKYWTDGLTDTTTVSVATNYYNVSGLTSGTSYGWMVRNASCATGTPAFSSVVAFATKSSCFTYNLYAADVTHNSATLSWAAVAGAVSYDVEYREGTSGAYNTPINTSTNSYGLTSLTAGTLYQFRVTPICISTGVTSDPVSFTTIDGCTPYNLKVTSVTTSGATLNWSGSSSITSYTLNYRKVGIKKWTVVSSATSPYTLAGLINGSVYEWSITAACTNRVTVTGPSFTAMAGTGTAVSGIVSAKEIGFNPLVMVYPNPTTDRFMIDLKGFEEGQVSIKVTDLYGRTLQIRDQYLIGGNGTLNLQLGNVSKGIYLINVIQKETNKSIKIQKN